MAIIRLEEGEFEVRLSFTKKAARHLYALMEDLGKADVLEVMKRDKVLANAIMQELDSQELDG